jgi:hypothetical protein
LNYVRLAKWAINIATHVLPYLEEEFPNEEKIRNGLNIYGRWQNGEAKVHEVRQAGLKVHEVAREYQKKLQKQLSLMVLKVL